MSATDTAQLLLSDCIGRATILHAAQEYEVAGFDEAGHCDDIDTVVAIGQSEGPVSANGNATEIVGNGNAVG